MIFVTGDTHGDFQRFGMKAFPEQKSLCRNDHMIICGDFGGVWDNSPRENYWLDWLDDKPWTTLWVDGNHENYDTLKALPVEEWHGGKVQRIRPNIIHLMRGQLYEIEGYTFFTMGGAQSHDIEAGILDPAAPDFKEQYHALRLKNARFRVLGRSWWPEELPSDVEYKEAFAALERANWEVDYVITHCAPTSIALSMDRHNEADRLTDFLEMVRRRLKFHYWLFGHYHRNMDIGEKFILLYQQIVQAI